MSFVKWTVSVIYLVKMTQNDFYNKDNNFFFAKTLEDNRLYLFYKLNQSIWQINKYIANLK